MNRVALWMSCAGLSAVVWGIQGLMSGDRVLAQAVIPDGTVNTSVLRSGDRFTINNGITSGNNLFHSFQEFSIPTGGAAIFNNPTNIQNIFSRVTGGQVSNIDGLIQANGAANLFLLNPSGIIFGKNAVLNIGGSFLSTTAQSIKFADGTEFSAAPTSPLLTISAPIGLQTGENPGAIALEATTLEVLPGKTIALVGGDLQQSGGTITVPGGGGRIALVGVGENSQVGLQEVSDGWSVDTQKVEKFRDITFKQSARVNGDGNGSAAITVAGNNINLLEETILHSYNTGDRSGGDIAVTAATSLLLETISGIRAELDGSGDGGNVVISAPKITLYNQSSFVSIAWGGTGNAGDVLVQGKEVTVTDDPLFRPEDGGNSTILSLAFDRGNAGNIDIIADVQNYTNGGGASNMTFGAGNSGTTTLRGQNITVKDQSGGATISTSTGAAGDFNVIADTLYQDNKSGFASGYYGEAGGRGGNINITARSIILRGDSGFDSETYGNGRAGTLTFRGDDIELDNSHLISSSASAGAAGNIDITAGKLRLLNGGQLNASAQSSGNSGEIRVNANIIELDGTPTKGVFSDQTTGIISSILPSENAEKTATNGGNIWIKASEMQIRHGALISASSSGDSGDGGNIDLQVDRLNLFNGGQILNITRGGGKAGDIAINARESIVISGQDANYKERQAAYDSKQRYGSVDPNLGSLSGIFGNATETATGSGGSIVITANTLQLQAGGTVSVSAQGSGNAGNLTINAEQLNLRQQGNLQAESANGTQGNIFLNLDRALTMRQGSVISTNAKNAASGGNISINTPVILGLENSDIIANAEQGRGGNVNITTQSIIGLKLNNTKTPTSNLDSDITASSNLGLNGTIQVNNTGIDINSGVVELPVNLSDPSQQISKNCAADQENRFIASGRSGLPSNPVAQRMGEESTWTDLRIIKPTDRGAYTADHALHNSPQYAHRPPVGTCTSPAPPAPQVPGAASSGY